MMKDENLPHMGRLPGARHTPAEPPLASQSTLRRPRRPPRAVIVRWQEAPNAESTSKSDEEAHRSRGHAARNAPTMLTAAAVVIDGFTASDILYPSVTNPASLRESRIMLDEAPTSVGYARPTETFAGNQEQEIQGTNEITGAPRSQGLSTTELTVAIAVPIGVIAFLLPLIILWCLSRKRRHKTEQTRLRHRSPPDTAMLKRRMQEDLAYALDERSPRSPLGTQNTIDVASPSRRPSRRVRRPRSARRSNSSLSGFNFDFSRRGTTFAKRLSQRPLPDPRKRHSRNMSRDPHSPYATHPTPSAPPYLSNEVGTSPSAPAGIQPSGDPPGSGSLLMSLAKEKIETGNDGRDRSSAASFTEPSPFEDSNHPGSDAISEISRMSVDHHPWTAIQRSGRDAECMSVVSALEPYPRTSLHPNPMV